jgi:hypothetical protein
MSIKEMMEQLIIDEEVRLGVGSPEFIQRHNEIMDEANRLLLHDLVIEQREEA